MALNDTAADAAGTAMAATLAALSDEDKDSSAKLWRAFFKELNAYLTSNAVVKSTLDSSLNTIFTSGVPVPTDGGTALKTAWTAITAAGAKDDATGTLE